MKKKDPRNIYDLALAEISETKLTIEKKTPDFMHFRNEDLQPVLRRANRNASYSNQTWSIPGKTYSWFPYFSMYLTSK